MRVLRIPFWQGAYMPEELAGKPVLDMFLSPSVAPDSMLRWAASAVRSD